MFTAHLVCAIAMLLGAVAGLFNIERKEGVAKQAWISIAAEAVAVIVVGSYLANPYSGGLDYVMVALVPAVVAGVIGIKLLVENTAGLAYFAVAVKRGFGGTEAADSKGRREDLPQAQSRREGGSGRQVIEVVQPTRESSKVPASMDQVDANVGRYKGFLEEHEQRFREHQITKTLEETRKRVVKATELYTEGANFQKAKVELIRAQHELDTIDEQLRLSDLARQASLDDAQARTETAEARSEVERLRIAVEKAELEGKLRRQEPTQRTREEKWQEAEEEAIRNVRRRERIVQETLAARSRLLDEARIAYPAKTDEEIEEIVDRQMVEMGLSVD